MKQIRTSITAIFLLFFGLNFSQLQAQDVSKQKFDLDVSASYFRFTHDGKILDNYLLHADIGLFYNLNHKFSVGAYYGKGRYKEIEFIWIEKNKHYRTGSTEERSYADLFGISGKIHLLPLLFGTERTRFDWYMIGKIGLISLNSSNIENYVPVKGNFMDASFMTGTSFYFSKSFGMFAEAGYKYFRYHKGFNANCGLTFRF